MQPSFARHKNAATEATTIGWSVAALAASIVLLRATRRGSTHRITLVRDERGNEALVVSASVGGIRPGLFLIDSAYAGAPVISTAYLALSLPSRFHWTGRSVSEEYARATRALHESTSLTDVRHRAAVRNLLSTGKFRSFVSGCTMRLMGIGETSEAQADLLVGAALRLHGARPHSNDGVDTDVYVTNALPGSVHILTCDYLLHRAPCILRPRAGKLLFGSDASYQRRSFERFQAEFVGGAFCVPMEVGGTTMRIVVVVAAAAALSLGRSAAKRLRACSTTGTMATQIGVNGERVCSEALSARVRIGRHALDAPDVEVFVNSGEVEGADGYAGLGLLRAVDLWMTPEEIGFRPSGLPTRRSGATRDGKCEGTQTPPACTAGS